MKNLAAIKGEIEAVAKEAGACRVQFVDAIIWVDAVDLDALRAVRQAIVDLYVASPWGRKLRNYRFGRNRAIYTACDWGEYRFAMHVEITEDERHCILRGAGKGIWQ